MKPLISDATLSSWAATGSSLLDIAGYFLSGAIAFFIAAMFLIITRALLSPSGTGEREGKGRKEEIGEGEVRSRSGSA